MEFLSQCHPNEDDHDLESMEDLLPISKRTNLRVYLITLSQASEVLVLTKQGFADTAIDPYEVANAKVMHWSFEG